MPLKQDAATRSVPQVTPGRMGTARMQIETIPTLKDYQAADA
jgi:hypothetical protein